jgi:hypothetical protein
MLDPFFYLEWLTEEDSVSVFPELNLVNEVKDFTKILVIPFYPLYYQNFFNLEKIFESIFKPPKMFEQRTFYHLAVKSEVFECEYTEFLAKMKNTKTNFFTEDEFLLLRNLLLKNCAKEEYDKIITISNVYINFEHLKFLNHKELIREKINGN